MKRGFSCRNKLDFCYLLCLGASWRRLIMGVKAALPKYELYFYYTVLSLAMLWATSWIFAVSSCKYLHVKAVVVCYISVTYTYSVHTHTHTHGSGSTMTYRQSHVHGAMQNPQRSGVSINITEQRKKIVPATPLWQSSTVTQTNCPKQRQQNI